jgi:hypothetical protein
VPCLLILGLLSIPRTIIVVLVIFSDYIGRAFDSALWPILGFFFMPTTTLAWAWMENTRGEAGGVHLVIVIIAACLDLGVIGGGRSSLSRRRQG